MNKASSQADILFNLWNKSNRWEKKAGWWIRNTFTSNFYLELQILKSFC